MRQSVGPPVPVDTSLLPSSVTGAARSGAYLLSVAVPTALSATVVAFLAFCLWRARQRRRDGRPPRRRVARIIAASTASTVMVALTVLAVGAGINAYAGYFPTVTSVWQSTVGSAPAEVRADATTVRALARTTGARAGHPRDTSWRLRRVSLPDASLGIGGSPARQVVVATPPGYGDTSAAYPVIYLFGGYPGLVDDWFTGGRITRTIDALAADGRMPLPILVEPDINGGYTTDSEGLNAVRGPQVETWITRDVVGYVDSHYRTVAERSHRVIAGMSSGGFAALNIALRNQRLFGVVLALQPYGDPGAVTDRLLGGRRDLLRANSPTAYLPTLVVRQQIAVFLDVGGATGDVPSVRALASQLVARGLDVLLRVEPGQGHTWAETTVGAPYALAFAGARLGAPTLHVRAGRPLRSGSAGPG